MVYALLTDETTGLVLLVRRRGSALWTLPAGEIRVGTPVEDLLTSYSQRQTGIIPQSFSPAQAFAFGGVAHLVASAVVSRARAGARGRIEAIHWAPPHALPTETDPVARVAAASLAGKLRQAASAAVNAVATPRALTTA